MGNLASKLSYLLGTKHRIRQALQNKGAGITEETPFRQYAGFIDGLSVGGSGVTHDVTNVANNPTYNPGTHVGGIQWTDPSTDPPTDPEIECIEIFDLCGEEPVPVAEIPLGTQRWEPETGTHQYHVRVKFSDGTWSPGVELPETEYSIDYVAHLLTAIVPLTDPAMLILAFDNYVKLTDGTGFAVSGITDSLEYVDRLDDKTVRLRLATKCFVHGLTYKLNYDPAAGTLLQNDDNPVGAIGNHGILNYSDWLPAVFAAAEIPQALPSTLVVAMSRDVTVIDDSRFILDGTTAGILGVVTPAGSNAAPTIEFALTEPVDADETAIRLSMLEGGMVDDTGQPVAPFSNAIVLNNSPHTAIGVLGAEVPTSAPDTVVVVMDGAVTVGGETSGDGPLPGMGLTVADQDPAPEVTGWDISDGTIILRLDGNVLMGKAVGVSYDGAGGMRAVHGNDTVRAFACAPTNHSTYSVQELGDLPVGARLKFETFCGEPLKWLAKAQNHPDYPPGATTLVTEGILAFRCLDANEPQNSNVSRKYNGNNRYAHSNTRKWANSAAPAGQWYAPQHAVDAPPTQATLNASIAIGGEPYEHLAGFLHEFSAKGLAALMDTTLTVAKALVDGGGTETFVDKVFLLSPAEVGLAASPGYGTKLAGFSDNASRVARVDAVCAANTTALPDPPAAGEAWRWALRHPEAGVHGSFGLEAALAAAVITDGTMIQTSACGSNGFRPACNLHSSTLVTGGPDAEGYYSLA
jgi:hypothetical protein